MADLFDRYLRWRSREVDRRELPQVIEQKFGIPRAIASQALDGVELTQNG